MESTKGTIPAHCQLLIHATVRPIRRARYHWTMCYNILNASGNKVTYKINQDDFFLFLLFFLLFFNKENVL